MSAMEGALRRKEEVKRYYQNATAGLPETSGQLFAMLAEDEERHRLAISDLEQGAQATLHPSATLEKARFILRRLSFVDAASGDHEELEVFYRAMDMEAASAERYARLAEESSGWQKELFRGIAAEEEMHFTLLENLREILDPGP
ncbi:ferritin [Geomonas sp. RF6]|uniref:ferritin family protein n=1 Tax=Geomonas sp. RF6 TaxID=2897342 RepID=UPI001E4F7B01|nr:ferritin family protein [Geomonas sp. RF6]UFS69626.1 ferritin [Geomonas sp. RF6]